MIIKFENQYEIKVTKLIGDCVVFVDKHVKNSIGENNGVVTYTLNTFNWNIITMQFENHPSVPYIIKLYDYFKQNIDFPVAQFIFRNIYINLQESIRNRLR